MKPQRIGVTGATLVIAVGTLVIAVGMALILLVPAAAATGGLAPQAPSATINDPGIITTRPISITGTATDTPGGYLITQVFYPATGTPVIEVPITNTLAGGSGSWSSVWNPVFNGTYRIKASTLTGWPENPATTYQVLAERDVVVNVPGNMDATSVSWTCTPSCAGVNTAGLAVMDWPLDTQQMLVLPIIDTTPVTNTMDLEDLSDQGVIAGTSGTMFRISFNTGTDRTPYQVLGEGDIDSWSFNSATRIITIDAQPVTIRRASDGYTFYSILAVVVDFNSSSSFLNGAHFSTTVYRDDITGSGSDATKRGGVEISGYPGSTAKFKAFFPTAVLTGWGVTDPSTQLTGYLDGAPVGASNATVTNVTGGAILRFDVPFASQTTAFASRKAAAASRKAEGGAPSQNLYLPLILR